MVKNITWVIVDRLITGRIERNVVLFQIDSEWLIRVDSTSRRRRWRRCWVNNSLVIVTVVGDGIVRDATRFATFDETSDGDNDHDGDESDAENHAELSACCCGLCKNTKKVKSLSTVIDWTFSGIFLSFIFSI